VATHGSIAKAERERREAYPEVYYGRSLWRARRGDEIVALNGSSRGYVVEAPNTLTTCDARGSRTERGIRVKLTNSRSEYIVNANEYRHVRQSLDSALARRK